jgi:hypothetical protein
MADVFPIYHGPNVVFVPGIPAIPHLDITDKEAAALVATGAFTYEKPPPIAKPAKPTEPTKPVGSSDSEE